MRRLILLTAFLVAVMTPASASAATCSDYSTQADAQRAADTRDADGDGIYCESLPCPCLKPGSSGSGGGGSTPAPRPVARRPAVHCGTERWNVKTAQDKRASLINLTPHRATIDQLRALEVPAGFGTHAPRFSPVETTTWRVRARLRSFKGEEDGDIHLVIASLTTGKTMIVEFPNVNCLKRTGPVKRRRIVAARNALVRRCGVPGTSRFRFLHGIATIDGVGFFDVLHGQRGVAPNGIELHPVMRFTGGC